MRTTTMIATAACLAASPAIAARVTLGIPVDPRSAPQRVCVGQPLDLVNRSGRTIDLVLAERDSDLLFPTGRLRPGAVHTVTPNRPTRALALDGHGRRELVSFEAVDCANGR